jgi:hypothetical protein
LEAVEGVIKAFDQKTINQINDTREALQATVTEVQQFINENFGSGGIKNLGTDKLDAQEFSNWKTSDFQKISGELVQAVGEISALAKNSHLHDNQTILNQITAAFTTALQQKLIDIEAGANKYVHPSKPASGNNETIAQAKFVAGVVADDKGHIVELVTKDANTPNSPVILDSEGRIEAKFLSPHNHIGIYEPKDVSLQAQKHTHSNKSVLDGITSDMISTWNNFLPPEISSLPDGDCYDPDYWAELTNGVYFCDQAEDSIGNMNRPATEQAFVEIKGNMEQRYILWYSLNLGSIWELSIDNDDMKQWQRITPVDQANTQEQACGKFWIDFNGHKQLVYQKTFLFAPAGTDTVLMSDIMDFSVVKCSIMTYSGTVVQGNDTAGFYIIQKNGTPQLRFRCKDTDGYLGIKRVIATIKYTK